tara:strand:+ start:1985 stop:3211 length:1227 start_codon:yes stop_codon:yes gene_type:complete
MAIPNGGLITETNRQYYEGAQGFITAGIGEFVSSFFTTFNTDLIFGSWDPNEIDYALNNFKLYTSPNGLPDSFEEYVSSYQVSNNIITITDSIASGVYFVVQLKTLSGGNYGDKDAFGDTVEENYGSYAYISLNDIVNNFIVAYVGSGKLISDVKRTDVIFHAKRGMQEFSYDTLKSIKSQELNIPPSLSVIIPQDYVNYVKMSWIDTAGVKHPIYPVNALTTNPYENPIQDSNGRPIQDNFDENIEGDSLTEQRWNNNRILQNFYNVVDSNSNFYNNTDGNRDRALGQIYGLDPQYANINGYFSINDRENKISFSSDLVGKLIVLEYISDGLAYDLDSRLPKMAEDAMYSYILYAIVSTRIGSQEYLVRRLKQDKSTKLRNTKIRLSNIKLEEITQVLRGKSKWIKH